MDAHQFQQAAAELGLMPTTEGSLALKLDVSQIIDGFAGSEHALPTPLYRDVIELVARSGTSYDATLQTSRLAKWTGVAGGAKPRSADARIAVHPGGPLSARRGAT